MSDARTDSYAQFIPPHQNRGLDAIDRRGGILLGWMKYRAGKQRSFIVRPRKAIIWIVLWSFLFNTLFSDIQIGKAWADAAPAGSSSVDPNRPAGSGLFKEIKADTFQLPKNLGSVKDIYRSNSDMIAIHIQDAHCNYACQQKIAQIIEYLIKEYGIDTINLEGGAKDYNLSIFTQILDKQIREKVADYFLREGVINGAEYFAVNNPDSIKLWGLEDEKLYIENLKIYRDSLSYKSDVENKINLIDSALTALKRHIYSDSLFGFDATFAKYKEGEMELKPYLDYLISMAKKMLIDVKSLTNIYLMTQLFDQESLIDFKKANNERDLLIDRLQKKISKRSMEELVEKTVEFKKEIIAQEEYYRYLIGRAKAVNIEIADFPELQKYVVYLSMYDAIDKSRTMDEIENLEDQIRDLLCATQEQRELASLSRNLVLTKNFFNISIARKDYEYYLKNKALFETGRYTKFIDKNAPLHKLNIDLGSGLEGLDRRRKEMAGFYEYSFKRDAAFLKNMKFASNKKKIAVFVTGGFHGENLKELFKKKEMSYISIMPGFKCEEGYACPYFKILSGGASAFEKSIGAAFSSMQVASLLTELGIKANDPLRVELFRVGVLALSSVYKNGGGACAFGLKEGGYVLFRLKDGSPACEIVADVGTDGVKIVGQDIEKNPSDILASLGKVAGAFLPSDGSEAARLVLPQETGSLATQTPIDVQDEPVPAARTTPQRAKTRTSGIDPVRVRQQFGNSAEDLYAMGFKEPELKEVMDGELELHLDVPFELTGQEKTVLREEFREIITRRSAQPRGGREVVLYGIGIGDEPVEAEETIVLFYETLASMGQDAENWQLSFIGIDISDSIVKKTNDRFAEISGRPEFARAHLYLKAVKANAVLKEDLEKIFVNEGRKKADIILNRHTHYGNIFSGMWHFTPETLMRERGCRIQALNLFLQLKNIFAVFGSAGGLYMAETANMEGQPKPYLAIPGTRAVGEPGLGFYRIDRPEADFSFTELLMMINNSRIGGSPIAVVGEEAFRYAQARGFTRQRAQAMAVYKVAETEGRQRYLAIVDATDRQDVNDALIRLYLRAVRMYDWKRYQPLGFQIEASNHFSIRGPQNLTASFQAVSLWIQSKNKVPGSNPIDVVEAHIVSSFLHEMVHNERGEDGMSSGPYNEIMSQLSEYMAGAGKVYNEGVEEALDYAKNKRGEIVRARGTEVYSPSMYAGLLLLAEEARLVFPELTEAIVSAVISDKRTEEDAVGRAMKRCAADEPEKMERLRRTVMVKYIDMPSADLVRRAAEIEEALVVPRLDDRAWAKIPVIPKMYPAEFRSKPAVTTSVQTQARPIQGAAIQFDAVQAEPTGDLIGKLFDSSGAILTELSVSFNAQESSLIITRPDGNIIYRDNNDPIGREVRLKVGQETLPGIEVAGYRNKAAAIHSETERQTMQAILDRVAASAARVLEDNDLGVLGVPDKDGVLYLARSLIDLPVARFHEAGELYLARNPQLIPEGVNAHNYLRGCGKDVRGAYYQLTIDKTRDPAKIIENLGTNMPRPMTESEKNLIKYNIAQGRTGWTILYGLQDDLFGAVVNEAFSNSIYSTQMKPQVLSVDPDTIEFKLLLAAWYRNQGSEKTFKELLLLDGPITESTPVMVLLQNNIAQNSGLETIEAIRQEIQAFVAYAPERAIRCLKEAETYSALYGRKGFYTERINRLIKALSQTLPPAGLIRTQTRAWAKRIFGARLGSNDLFVGAFAGFWEIFSVLTPGFVDSHMSEADPAKPQTALERTQRIWGQRFILASMFTAAAGVALFQICAGQNVMGLTKFLLIFTATVFGSDIASHIIWNDIFRPLAAFFGYRIADLTYAGNAYDAIDALKKRLNKFGRNTPKILAGGTDVDRNLAAYIERIRSNRTITLLPEQEARLRELFRRYEECERLTHFVNRDYVGSGRLGFLFDDSGGTILPAFPIIEIILTYHNQLRHTFIAAGEGFGYGDETDAAVDAGHMLSTCYELWEGLGAPVPVHQRAGMAIVLKPEAARVAHLVAVNVPDEDYLGSFFGGPVTNVSKIREHILSLAGLNLIKEELLVAGGMDAMDTPEGSHPGTLRHFIGEHYGPLSPREVMIPEGVGPDFIERIVVSDDINERIQGLFDMEPVLRERWQHLIVTEEEYVRTEPRIREGLAIKKEIEELLSGAAPAGNIARGDAKLLSESLDSQTLRPTRESIDINTVVTALHNRINASNLSQQQKDEVNERIDYLKDRIKEFNAIILHDQADKKTITGWLLGFNTMPRAPNAQGDDPENALQKLLQAKHKDTLCLSTEVLDLIEDNPALLEEYILHEIICPYLGHIESRKLQEAIFADNYADAKGESGHKDGLLTPILQKVISGNRLPTQYDFEDELIWLIPQDAPATAPIARTDENRSALITRYQTQFDRLCDLGIRLNHLKAFSQLFKVADSDLIWKKLTGTGQGELSIPADKLRQSPMLLWLDFEENVLPKWNKLTGTAPSELGIPAEKIRQNPSLLALDFEGNILPKWQKLTGTAPGELGIPADKVRQYPVLLTLDFEGNIQPKYYYLVNVATLDPERIWNSLSFLASSLNGKIRPRTIFLMLHGIDANGASIFETPTRARARLHRFGVNPVLFDAFMQDHERREGLFNQAEALIRKKAPKGKAQHLKELKADMVWLRVYFDEYRIATTQGLTQKAQAAQAKMSAIVNKVEAILQRAEDKEALRRILAEALSIENLPLPKAAATNIFDSQFLKDKIIAERLNVSNRPAGQVLLDVKEASQLTKKEALAAAQSLLRWIADKKKVVPHRADIADLADCLLDEEHYKERLARKNSHNRRIYLVISSREVNGAIDNQIEGITEVADLGHGTFATWLQIAPENIAGRFKGVGEALLWHVVNRESQAAERFGFVFAGPDAVELVQKRGLLPLAPYDRETLASAIRLQSADTLAILEAAKGHDAFAAEILNGVRSQPPQAATGEEIGSAGDLIGKLYTHPTLRDDTHLARNIASKKTRIGSDYYVELYWTGDDGTENPLYDKEGRKVERIKMIRSYTAEEKERLLRKINLYIDDAIRTDRVRLGTEIELLRKIVAVLQDKDIVILESNIYGIQGLPPSFVNSKDIYLSQKAIENPLNYIALFHEGGEACKQDIERITVDPGVGLMNGVNTHTYLRGCGEDVSAVISWNMNLPNEPEALIRYLENDPALQYRRQKKNLPALTDEEKNLIRFNYHVLGIRYGSDLVHGLQHRVFNVITHNRFTEILKKSSKPTTPAAPDRAKVAELWASYRQGVDGEDANAQIAAIDSAISIGAIELDVPAEVRSWLAERVTGPLKVSAIQGLDYLGGEAPNIDGFDMDFSGPEMPEGISREMCWVYMLLACHFTFPNYEAELELHVDHETGEAGWSLVPGGTHGGIGIARALSGEGWEDAIGSLIENDSIALIHLHPATSDSIVLIPSANIGSMSGRIEGDLAPGNILKDHWSAIVTSIGVVMYKRQPYVTVSSEEIEERLHRISESFADGREIDVIEWWRQLSNVPGLDLRFVPFKFKLSPDGGKIMLSVPDPLSSAEDDATHLFSGTFAIDMRLNSIRDYETRSRLWKLEAICKRIIELGVNTAESSALVQKATVLVNEIMIKAPESEMDSAMHLAQEILHDTLSGDSGSANPAGNIARVQNGGSASELIRAFKGSGKIASLRKSIDMPARLASLKTRVAGSNLPQAARDEIDSRIDALKGKILEFSAVILRDKTDRNIIKGWLLGFNTMPRAPDAELEQLEKDLHESLNIMLHGSILLAREVLDAIGSRQSLFEEYLFHETVCPYLGHIEARKLQEEIFPENYQNATGESGHKDGDLALILQEVIEQEPARERAQQEDLLLGRSRETENDIAKLFALLRIHQYKYFKKTSTGSGDGTLSGPIQSDPPAETGVYEFVGGGSLPAPESARIFIVLPGSFILLNSAAVSNGLVATFDLTTCTGVSIKAMKDGVAYYGIAHIYITDAVGAHKKDILEDLGYLCGNLEGFDSVELLVDHVPAAYADFDPADISAALRQRGAKIRDIKFRQRKGWFDIEHMTVDGAATTVVSADNKRVAYPWLAGPEESVDAIKLQIKELTGHAQELPAILDDKALLSAITERLRSIRSEEGSERQTEIARHNYLEQLLFALQGLDKSPWSGGTKRRAASAVINGMATKVYYARLPEIPGMQERNAPAYLTFADAVDKLLEMLNGRGYDGKDAVTILNELFSLSAFDAFVYTAIFERCHAGMAPLTAQEIDSFVGAVTSPLPIMGERSTRLMARDILIKTQKAATGVSITADMQEMKEGFDWQFRLDDVYDEFAHRMAGEASLRPASLQDLKRLFTDNSNAMIPTRINDEKVISLNDAGVQKFIKDNGIRLVPYDNREILTRWTTAELLAYASELPKVSYKTVAISESGRIYFVKEVDTEQAARAEVANIRAWRASEAITLADTKGPYVATNFMFDFIDSGRLQERVKNSAMLLPIHSKVRKDSMGIMETLRMAGIEDSAPSNFMVRVELDRNEDKADGVNVETVRIDFASYQKTLVIKPGRPGSGQPPQYGPADLSEIDLIGKLFTSAGPDRQLVMDLRADFNASTNILTIKRHSGLPIFDKNGVNRGTSVEISISDEIYLPLYVEPSKVIAQNLSNQADRQTALMILEQVENSPASILGNNAFNIAGIPDKDGILYLHHSLIDSPIARFHEAGEFLLGRNINMAPKGVNNHTYLRGCGKDVRSAYYSIDEKERPEEVEALIAVLNKKMTRALADSESNLMRYNASQGRTGADLLYGLQDTIFGERVNENFSLAVAALFSSAVPGPGMVVATPILLRDTADAMLSEAEARLARASALPGRINDEDARTITNAVMRVRTILPDIEDIGQVNRISQRADSLELAVKTGGIRDHIARLDALRQRLQRSDLPKVINFGDKHGISSDMARISRFARENKTAGGKLVLVGHGDFFDRGTENMANLAYLKEMKKLAQDQANNLEVHLLLGNHELMFIRAMLLGDEDEMVNWVANGGIALVNELGILGKAGLENVDPKDYIEVLNFINNNKEFVDNLDTNEELRSMAMWMVQNMELSYEDEWGFLHVHAGIPADNNANPLLSRNRLDALNAEFKAIGDLAGQGRLDYNRLKELLLAASPLFWVREGDWIVNMCQDSQIWNIKIDSVNEAKLLAIFADTIGIRFAQQWKLIVASDINYQEFLRHRGVEFEVLPVVAAKAKIDNFTAALGYTGVIFGHIHLYKLLNLDNRIFCIDTDRMDSGYLNFDNSGMTFTNTRIRRDEIVAGKPEILAGLTDQIIRLKKLLGEETSGDEEALAAYRREAEVSAPVMVEEEVSEFLAVGQVFEKDSAGRLGRPFSVSTQDGRFDFIVDDLPGIKGAIMMRDLKIEGKPIGVISSRDSKGELFPSTKLILRERDMIELGYDLTTGVSCMIIAGKTFDLVTYEGGYGLEERRVNIEEKYLDLAGVFFNDPEFMNGSERVIIKPITEGELPQDFALADVDEGMRDIQQALGIPELHLPGEAGPSPAPEAALPLGQGNAPAGNTLLIAEPSDSGPAVLARSEDPLPRAEASLRTGDMHNARTAVSEFYAAPDIGLSSGVPTDNFYAFLDWLSSRAQSGDNVSGAIEVMRNHRGLIRPGELEAMKAPPSTDAVEILHGLAAELAGATSFEHMYCVRNNTMAMHSCMAWIERARQLADTDLAGASDSLAAYGNIYLRTAFLQSIIMALDFMTVEEAYTAIDPIEIYDKLGYPLDHRPAEYHRRPSILAADVLKDYRQYLVFQARLLHSAVVNIKNDFTAIRAADDGPPADIKYLKFTEADLDENLRMLEAIPDLIDRIEAALRNAAVDEPKSRQALNDDLLKLFNAFDQANLITLMHPIAEIKKAISAEEAVAGKTSAAAPRPKRPAVPLARADRKETRKKAVLDAFVDTAGKDEIVKIVVGVPSSMSDADVQPILSDINRALKGVGYGQREDNKQVIKFTIENDPVKTKENMDAAVAKAKEGLPSDGSIVLYAPQIKGMEIGKNGLAQLAQEEYKAQEDPDGGAAATIVVPDAYSDLAFPDIMLRVVLGRNIAFGRRCEELGNEEGKKTALAVINKLLSKVMDGYVDIGAIKDLLNIARPIRIRPVDYEADMSQYKIAQKAVATSV